MLHSAFSSSWVDYSKKCPTSILLCLYTSWWSPFKAMVKHFKHRLAVTYQLHFSLSQEAQQKPWKKESKEPWYWSDKCFTLFNGQCGGTTHQFGFLIFFNLMNQNLTTLDITKSINGSSFSLADQGLSTFQNFKTSVIGL